ncbi:MAG: ABC transporter transmembrane domain-containing protein, partial [Candidatus Heimdallarchaeota archaeon]
MGWHRGGHFSALIEDDEEKKRLKVTSDWTLAKWILSFIFGEYKGLAIVALLLVAFSSVLDLVSPLIMKFIIDNVFKNATSTIAELKRLLLILTLALLGTTILTAVVQIFRTILLYKIGYNTVKKIRTDTFRHMQSLSMKFFDNQEAGRLISKVTNDCDKINELVSGGIITSLIDFITLIGISIVLFVLDWR